MSNDAEVRARRRGFGQGLDHIANFINALDSEGMSGRDVRSAIYAECLAAEARSHDGEWEAMRERCAKVCDDIAAEWRSKEKGYREAGNNGPYLGTPSASTCAQAIRSLSAVPLLDEG